MMTPRLDRILSYSNRRIYEVAFVTCTVYAATTPPMFVLGIPGSDSISCGCSRGYGGRDWGEVVEWSNAWFRSAISEYAI